LGKFIIYVNVIVVVVVTSNTSIKFYFLVELHNGTLLMYLKLTSFVSVIVCVIIQVTYFNIFYI